MQAWGDSWDRVTKPSYVSSQVSQCSSFWPRNRIYLLGFPMGPLYFAGCSTFGWVKTGASCLRPYHQVLVEVLISAGSQEKKQWRNTGLWIRGGGPGYKGHVIANQSISKTNKTETKGPSEFWEQAESRMPLELSKQASKQNRTSRRKCFPDRLDTLHQILWRQTEKVSIKWPQIPCFNVETVSWRFIVLQNKERHKSRQI